MANIKTIDERINETAESIVALITEQLPEDLNFGTCELTCTEVNSNLHYHIETTLEPVKEGAYEGGAKYEMKCDAKALHKLFDGLFKLMKRRQSAEVQKITITQYEEGLEIDFATAGTITPAIWQRRDVQDGN